MKKLTVDKQSKIRLKIECVLDSDVSEIGKEEKRSLKYQRSLPQIDRVLMAVIPLESAAA